MIGTYNYRLVTETLAESQDLGSDALSNLICMRNELLGSDINQYNRFRRNLLNTIDGTYNYIALKHFNLSRPMQKFVRNLQDHVLKHYGEEFGYTTINEFLIDQYIQVPQTFADISGFLGYPITEVGAKAARWKDLDDVQWNEIDLSWQRIGWENL